MYPFAVFDLYFLLRFSTRRELVLNGLALTAAAAAGACQVCVWTFFPSPSASNNSTDGCFPQPLMSLLFGNLVQSFVNFNTAIRDIPNSPESSVIVEEAAHAFRHAAAEDASYLTYIGA